MDDDKRWTIIWLTGGFATVLVALAVTVGLGVLIGHYVINPRNSSSSGQPTAAGSTSTSSSSSGSGKAVLVGPSDSELTTTAGADWPSVGGDLGNTRYSSLTQIDTSNVSKLHLVWQASYGPTITPSNYVGGAPLDVEGTPLVYSGIMYNATPQGDVLAIKAASGAVIWRWKSNVTSSDNLSVTTSASRGIALGGGNVYTETSAGALVAINATNGHLRWQAQVAVQGQKLESPAVGQYYNGVVYIGVSGAEVARGQVSAYDASTGKRLWRTFDTCGPEGTPPADGQCPASDKASPDTGGGSVWTYPALDPADGVVLATTANPSVNDGIPGDDKWTNSIIALNMKTGHIEWGFQGVHHDIWDADCLTPPVLFSNKFGGSQKAGVEFTCKTDEHFELAPKTGTPLLPVKEVPVPTAAGGITPDVAAQKFYAASPTQPIPSGNSETGSTEIVPHCATPALLPDPAPDGSKYVYSCTFAAPGTKAFIAHGISYLGGQDDDPLSYDPQTGDMYYCEKVSVYASKRGSVQSGGSFIGVTTGWAGSVAGVNVKNNNLAWRDKYTASKDGNCFGGTASTAGNLVFAASNKGNLYAYNAKTGAQLWSYHAPDYIAAPPMVYSVNGNEYVEIYVGGQVTELGGETTPHLGRVMVFSIDGATRASASAKLTTTPTATATTSTSSEKSSSGAHQVNAAGTAAGKALFTKNCGSCHTLAEAGTTGNVGPNLDQLKPNYSTVSNMVENGGGAMPAFGKSHLLTAAQIKAVSTYVSSVAGQKTGTP